jgi:hyperosmotically inducible periplasmic protein
MKCDASGGRTYFQRHQLFANREGSVQRYINIFLASIVLISAPSVLGHDTTAQAFGVKDLLGDSSQTDESLQAQIEERLRADDRIDWEVLEVRVKRGEVTLYGEVQTEDQKGLASLIVTTVPGVAGITNSIIVEPGPYTKDHGLQKAIWQSIRSVDALRQQTHRLKVQVKNQVATLSGSVEQSLQKEAAEKAAEAVTDVEKVINIIQVRHLERTGEREKLREQGLQQLP